MSYVAWYLPVAVDAVDEKLARAERLHSARHGDHVEAAALAPALHRTLVPAQTLTRRSARAPREPRRVVGERMAVCVGRRLHPHAAWVDRDDHSLQGVTRGTGERSCGLQRVVAQCRAREGISRLPTVPSLS